MNDRLIASLLSTIVFALVLVASACGDAEDICASFCDCENCTDAELDACISDFRNQQDSAEAADCGDEYGTYMECVDHSWTCVAEVVVVEGCDEQFDAYAQCLMTALVPEVAEPMCDGAA